jgi:deazaflavin-dependent oxidoreductase (nitroreductase family)
MSDETEKKPEPGYKAPDIGLVGAEHIRRYLETDGEVGYIWNGVTTLLFTTKGRSSGKPRQNAIIFSQDGDNYVIIASKGGAPEDPAWYRNILADPHVQVQVKGDKFDAIARVAKSPERERLWQGSVAIWPNFDVYQTRTARQIPVVVLERVKPGA